MSARRVGVMITCLWPVIAFAQLPLPPSPNHGTDGPFDLTGLTGNFIVDLSLAPTADWSQPGGDLGADGFGDGVYDADEWAVVFKFTDVIIPAGVTVRFINHPSRAPVVWLVENDVTIDGAIDLSGADGHTVTGIPVYSEPGPGGFRGGTGTRSESLGSGGFGPGGANIGDGCSGGSGGGFAENGLPGTQGGGVPGGTYGNDGAFPLIGGSGGSGGQMSTGALAGSGAGAGGGAILIACSGTITVSGTIRADGGDGFDSGVSGCQTGQQPDGGGGSAGAIRLISDTLVGTGFLSASGGSGDSHGGRGGAGRIRIEANDLSLFVGGSNPALVGALPGAVAKVFRDTSTPSIEIISLGGLTPPPDPRAQMAFPGSDMQFDDGANLELQMESFNVPEDATVTVRVVRGDGAVDTPTATLFSPPGSADPLVWTITLDLSNGLSAIQARASF